MIKMPRRDTHSSVSQTAIQKRLKRDKNVTNCDTKTAKADKQIYKNVTKSNTRTAIRHWRYGHSDNKQDDLAAPQGHTLICFSNSNTKVANRDTKTAKTWQITLLEQQNMAAPHEHAFVRDWSRSLRGSDVHVPGKYRKIYI
jgi:hypothetical protein